MQCKRFAVIGLLLLSVVVYACASTQWVQMSHEESPERTDMFIRVTGWWPGEVRAIRVEDEYGDSSIHSVTVKYGAGRTYSLTGAFYLSGEGAVVHFPKRVRDVHEITFVYVGGVSTRGGQRLTGIRVWGRPPNPPPGSPPAITGVTPHKAAQGETVSVRISGSGFQAGATLAFGSEGVTVISRTVESSNRIWAQVAIANNASGGHDLVVTNPDLQSATLPDALRVEPAFTLLMTNDVHGLLESRLESGATMGGIIRREYLAERNRDPEGVLLVDAGDITYSGGESVRDYAARLLSMRALGYEAVTVGNHDCCGGNADYGEDWNDAAALATAVAVARAAGLHVLSANIRRLADRTAMEHSQWLPYASGVERTVVVERKGLRIGLFGLTAPVLYHANLDPLYQVDPFRDDTDGLSESQMETAASEVVEALRQGADLVIALAHIGLDGSRYSPPDTGCLQLIQSTGPHVIHLPVDLVVCGHSHSTESPSVVHRRDGGTAYAIEASDYPSGPRLGKLRLAVEAGGLVVKRYDAVPLDPMYHAGEVPFQDPPRDRVPATVPGSTIPLTVKFRNAGTRTWFKSARYPDLTRVVLGEVDARTAAPKSPSVRGASVEMQEDAVKPGETATFRFTVMVPANAEASQYDLRVAPLAESALTKTLTWMNRGDAARWSFRANGRRNQRGHLESGGMGTVYRAEDTRLGRQVALKFGHGAWLAPGTPPLSPGGSDSSPNE